ncbi:glutamate--cysteine ligase [Halococcus hamelinensis]|uniref:glutamate--cysteine ligase n=1 Tax=Halococcus hamelinensis TaxID=332168 RepID=UPI0004953988|nr:glutamate--cysteine ligase [Halococcus hamelinensis]
MSESQADEFVDIGTLGVEEEFFAIDGDGYPTGAVDELIADGDPPPVLDGRLDREMFKCIVETKTPVCEDLAAAHDRVVAIREALVEYAADHGFGIAAAGLHPAAHWDRLECTEAPRYYDMRNRIQLPQNRNTTAGLHVHVGVDDPDKATWVANEIRWFLPVMLALSANSPYWRGVDTGLASARTNVFGAIPNTGIPPVFEDFEAFERFERLLIETNSIADRRDLWYDVRLHTGCGTVEVRMPDAQSDVERTLAFVEYVRALVVDLAERYEDGETGRNHRYHTLVENKWRATRNGHEATFIDREEAGTVPLAEVVEHECDRLGIDGIARLLDDESGALRQRRLHREGGLEAVCHGLRVGS